MWVTKELVAGWVYSRVRTLHEVFENACPRRGVLCIFGTDLTDESQRIESENMTIEAQLRMEVSRASLFLHCD